jgi:hypothetical protein
MMSSVIATMRDGVLQCVDLFLCERPHRARWQIAEAHGADGDPFEPLHFVADAGQQATNFAVAAFVEDHFKDRGLLAAAFDPYVLHVSEALGEVNAALKLSKYIRLDLASDLNLVNLFDAVAWVREAVGKLAVVRDKDQPFAREVKAADAVHAGRIGGQQIDDARPAGRIARRRHDALRLIDGEVHQLRSRQCLAVDADFLLLGIDARAQFGHNLSVHFDAAFKDELLAFASAGDSGCRENFLQPVAAGGFGTVLNHIVWPRGKFRTAITTFPLRFETRL